jgi:cytidylate kinase
MTSIPPIDRLVKFIFDEHKHLKARESREEIHLAPPLVTLTHDFGSGAEAIGRALADCLHVDFIGDEFSHQHSDRHHIETLILKRLEQHARSATQRALSDYLSGSPDTLVEYRKELVAVLLHLAEQHGGVIVDRGAHVILRDRPVLRVRIVGSELACARRIAQREGVDVEIALEKVRKINLQRQNYLRSLVGEVALDAHHFDVIINTDHFNDLSTLHHGLLDVMRAMGLNTGGVASCAI